MGLMVVTNIAAGAGADVANIQLVEVQKTTPNDQPLNPPQGVSSFNLVLPINEASTYPVGSQWEMTLKKVEGK